MLPGLPNSTNFLILKFPVICKKIERGENVFYLDATKVGRYSDLTNADINQLSTSLCGEVIPRTVEQSHTEKANQIRRALEYKSLIDNGIVKNQSELAKYLGKSRAWVSKVMKVLEEGKS